MEKKLYRSKEDRKMTGLCGGIGEYFGVDPTIIRILVVLIAMITAFVPALIIYFVISAIVPEKDEKSGGAQEVDYKFVDPNKPDDGNHQ